MLVERLNVWLKSDFHPIVLFHHTVPSHFYHEVDIE